LKVNRVNPVVTLDVTANKSPVYSLEYNLHRYSFFFFIVNVVLVFYSQPGNKA